MVKKWIKNFVLTVFFNPIFTSAFICSILFYSNLVSLKDSQNVFSLYRQEEITSIEGELISSPVKMENIDFYSSVFFVNSVSTSKNYKSHAKGKTKVLIPADFVEALYPGKLFTENKNKSGVLFESGIALKLDVEYNDDNDFYIVKTACQLPVKNNFNNRIKNLRAKSRLYFKRLMYTWGNAGGLLLALISGAKEYIEKDTYKAFRRAGLSHILALSGMHLNLFGGLAFFFGKKITRKTYADFFQLSAICFFVWFCGTTPSLIRAMISSIIVFFNSLLKMNRFKGLTVLSLCFLLQSVLFPQHIHTQAFILSYSALAGIMILGEILKKIIGKFLFPYFSYKFSESAGAQFFTAPVSVKYFGTFYPVGIISTIIINPLINLFLYIGLFGIFICLFLPFLSEVFNVIINYIYLILKKLVFYFSNFPPLEF